MHRDAKPKAPRYGPTSAPIGCNLAWSPTEPDVRTSQDVELDAVAHAWWDARRRGVSEAEFREALRQSERYAIYATFEELPERPFDRLRVPR